MSLARNPSIYLQEPFSNSVVKKALKVNYYFIAEPITFFNIYFRIIKPLNVKIQNEILVNFIRSSVQTSLPPPPLPLPSTFSFFWSFANLLIVLPNPTCTSYNIIHTRFFFLFSPPFPLSCSPRLGSLMKNLKKKKSF